MKNLNFFEKLWEHSRTLRRVGLVLVMCLITITQAWAVINASLYSGDRLYIDCTNWTSDNAGIKLSVYGTDGKWSKDVWPSVFSGKAMLSTLFYYPY